MIEIKQFDLTPEDVLNIPPEGILIPESDYGLAEIYKGDDGFYHLFEIPMYGGEPQGPCIVENPAEVVAVIQSWT